MLPWGDIDFPVVQLEIGYGLAAKAGNHVRDIGKRHLVKVDGLAGHLPSAGGMSGLRVADWKCGSQTDDGTKKSIGFFPL